VKRLKLHLSGWIREHKRKQKLFQKNLKKTGIAKNIASIMFLKRYRFLRSQAIIFQKKEKAKHPKL